MMGKKIAGLAGTVLALGLVLVGCPTSDIPDDDGLPPLWQVYEDHFALGNIIQSVYRNDLANRRLSNLLSRHFNLLTAENDMKPSALRRGTSYPGTWEWSHAERLLNFAEANDIRFHGHTLAWHAQTPRWLVPDNISREEAIGRLERHIETVMLRVGNRVESWDVLNEVVTSGGPYWYGFAPRDNPNWDWRLGLRNVRDASDEMHPGAQVDWRGAIGDDYVEIAFRKARRVANENKLDVILYYNDYNLARFPIKMYAVYRMVKEINERHRDPGYPYHYLVAGLPNQNLIQAIGTQGHYNYADNFIHGPDQLVRNMRNTLLRFASLGVYVSVTEFTLGYGTSGTGNWERRQAITMARLFNLFTSFAEAHPNRLRRVSLWGPDDGNSWRSGRAHLWDASLRPKEAFFAVADPVGFLQEHAPQHVGEFAGDTFTLPAP